jgi:hypothetical protein
MSAFGKSWGLAFGVAFGLVTVPQAEIDQYGGSASIRKSHLQTEEHAPYELPLRLRNAVDVSNPANHAGSLGSAGSVDTQRTNGPDGGRIDRIAPATPNVAVATPEVVGERNQHVAHADAAQAAINPVANKEEIQNGIEAFETIQAAQERQQLAQEVLKRQSDELALIMILLESV